MRYAAQAMVLGELLPLLSVVQDWDVCPGWYAAGAPHEASRPCSAQGHFCGCCAGGCTLCQQVEQRTSAVLLQVHPGEYTPAHRVQAAQHFWQLMHLIASTRKQQQAVNATVLGQVEGASPSVLWISTWQQITEVIVSSQASACSHLGLCCAAHWLQDEEDAKKGLYNW
jgi:hypothetical protein